jgi:hypothetical protein
MGTMRLGRIEHEGTFVGEMGIFTGYWEDNRLIFLIWYNLWNELLIWLSGEGEIKVGGLCLSDCFCFGEFWETDDSKVAVDLE